MERNNITICKMEINDLSYLKDTLSSDFDDFWSYDVLKEELSSPISTYIIAKINNAIVGFAGIKIIIDEAELMNIVVKKTCRNSGIASLLIEYLIKICKQKNIQNINLEVNSKNSIAINLYNKYNFIQVGLRKKYYNGINDAILMSLHLS